MLLKLHAEDNFDMTAQHRSTRLQSRPASIRFSTGQDALEPDDVKRY